MSEVVMPRLSDSMEEGMILRWLKATGDEVQRGEEIVEIETDKATMGYEADVSGILTVVADEGATLAIGATIAYIGQSVQQTTSPEQPSLTPASMDVGSQPAPADVSAGATAGDGEAGKASPVARRLAEKLGVDLASLVGTGPGGRIVTEDIEAAAKRAAAAPLGSNADTARGPVTTLDPSRLQLTIARRMTEVKATVPEFTISMKVDMSEALAVRAAPQAASVGTATPSLNDMIVKAAALALRAFPRVNATYKDETFELYDRVNVGFAVAASDALMVPTIFDADQKALAEIAAETRDLATRVREGRISPAELDGGTFTVSNLGMLGVSSFTAILNQGQAAILAVGALEDVPAVADGEFVVRKQLQLTLTCDHRILYGADAARFLGFVQTLLEVPSALAAQD